MRFVTQAVLFFFLWGNIHPALAAVKEEIQRTEPGLTRASLSRPLATEAGPQAAHTLETLRTVVGDLHAKLARHRELIIKRQYKDKKGELVNDITILGIKDGADDIQLKPLRQQLTAVRQQLAEQDRQTEAGFAADLAHLQAHQLPAVIQQRHADALAAYRQQRERTNQALDDLENSRSLKALLIASAQLLKDSAKDLPPQGHLNLKNLPFRTSAPQVRAPALTDKELRDILHSNLKPTRAALEVFDVAQRKQEASDTEIARSHQETLLADYWKSQRPSVEVASTGSMTGLLSAAAITPPGPETLAPTGDVQITPEIQALATQLHNHPVEIYNWARNNLEWVPSYGSIQGSQATLDKKSGNAFDIASLTIALLRASNIPARYVYGTVDIPADKLQNWIGGTTHPDAAQNIMGQGGIPNVGLTKAGVTSAIRMEHVWVEAFVDYHPSRAAKNLSPDSWIPMDTSFKQYTYTEGLNLQQAAPFDASAFLSSAQQGATVDEAAGTVQNLNQANIQSALNSYQSQLQNHIDTQNPDATVGEVLGAKLIQPISFPYLPASLPYSVKATGNRYSALPNHLRHQFQYALYTDNNQRVQENPIWQYRQYTADLASKKLTLSFVPATEDDQRTIESYLPKPHSDGSSIQPSEFPSQLPAYSIYVKPQLRLEGEIVATSSQSFTLGTELIGEGGFTNMNLQGYDLTQDSHIAGQSSALGLSIQGISSQQLTSIKSRLEQTKAKLESNESSQLETLTGEHLSGDLLSATIASYHASLESFGKLAQRQAKIVDNPGLSFGFFHAQAVPRKQYGVVTAVRFPGMLMDVGHIRRLSYSHNNQQADWVNYNRLRGQHSSAMEHAIPEQFFSDPNQTTKPEGVSAVKALAVAAQQGQRIYTLTQANQSQINNLQQSQAVKQNILAALNAGKEVTIHQSPINYAGFSGAGYVITDPQTGAGAYLIEGGARGAIIFLTFVLLIVGVAASYLAIGTIGPPLGLALFGLAVFGFFDYVDALESISNISDPNYRFSALNAISATACIGALIPVGVFLAAGAPGIALLALLTAFLSIPFQDYFFDTSSGSRP